MLAVRYLDWLDNLVKASPLSSLPSHLWASRTETRRFKNPITQISILLSFGCYCCRVSASFHCYVNFFMVLCFYVYCRYALLVCTLLLPCILAWLLLWQWWRFVESFGSGANIIWNYQTIVEGLNQPKPHGRRVLYKNWPHQVYHKLSNWIVKITISASISCQHIQSIIPM